MPCKPFVIAIAATVYNSHNYYICTVNLLMQLTAQSKIAKHFINFFFK